eukprot:247665-Prymnesium_polylepis.1
MQIYNESLSDLLVDALPHDFLREQGDAKDALRLREDPSGVWVDNLTSVRLKHPEDARQALAKGLAQRQRGATTMNAQSSRSHAVFTLRVQATTEGADGLQRMRTSRCNLVDLAGSERQKDSGATGSRLKEACNINRSLSVLGNVINALAEQVARPTRHPTTRHPTTRHPTTVHPTTRHPTARHPTTLHPAIPTRHPAPCYPQSIASPFTLLPAPCSLHPAAPHPVAHPSTFTGPPPPSPATSVDTRARPHRRAARRRATCRTASRS